MGNKVLSTPLRNDKNAQGTHQRSLGAYVVIVFVLALLIAMLGWLITCVTENFTAKTSPDGVPEQSVLTKKEPRLEDFLGKWSGRWDNTWAIYVTITQEPESEQLVFLYEWEEHIGHQLKQSRGTAILSNQGLQIGKSMTMSLSATDLHRAKMVGNFAKPRTADLVRDTSKVD